jgi:hypothetical protein
VVITFNAAPGMTSSMFESGLKSGQKDVKPVPGVADSAFSWGDSTGGTGSGLSFLSGTTVCSIVSTVSTTTSGKDTLAKAILGG